MRLPEPLAATDGRTFYGLNWWQARADVAEQLATERRDGGAESLLVVSAAQHLLMNGRTPGYEFTARNRFSSFLFHNARENGVDAHIYVPAHRHADRLTGREDQVALSDAGCLQLTNEFDVPWQRVHGMDWNDKYAPGGVYCNADEVQVVAAAFRADPSLAGIRCVVSPGQEHRARLHFLAQGVPVETVVPAELERSQKLFHGGRLGRLTAFVLEQYTQIIDPAWQRAGLPTAVRRNRIPRDGNIHTVPELRHFYEHFRTRELGS